MSYIPSLVRHITRRIPFSIVCLLLTVTLGIVHIRWGESSFGSAVGTEQNRMISLVLMSIATFGTFARELRSPKISQSIPVLLVRYALVYGIWTRLAPILSPIKDIVLGVMTVAAMISVFVVPLLGRNNSNRAINERLIRVALHTLRALAIFGLLAVGLMLCTAAFQELLGTVADNIFPTILLLSIGLLGGCIRMTGLSRTDDDRVSHKLVTIAIHLFGIIFGIILTCMGIILYLYFGKIYLQRDRPSNSVTVRGLLFVIGRIITMVVIRHETKQQKNLQRLTRRGFLILLPIVLIVTLAIRQRIEQYGITPKRYLVSAVIVRVLITIIAALFRNKRTLFISALSLRIISILSLIGRPLDVQTVSYHSQLNRLTHALTANNLLQDGTLTLPIPESVTADDRQTMASSLEYLLSNHPASLSKLDSQLTDADTTRRLFGVDREEARVAERYEADSNYLEMNSQPIALSGYSTLYPPVIGIAPGITITQGMLSVTLSGSTLIITTPKDITLLSPILIQYMRDRVAPSSEPIFLESDHFKVILSSFRYRVKDDAVTMESMDVTVLEKDE